VLLPRTVLKNVGRQKKKGGKEPKNPKRAKRLEEGENGAKRGGERKIKNN
jgi:hypothetical protein